MIKKCFKAMKDKQVEFVDLRFTDLKRWGFQYSTMDLTVFDED